MNKGKNHYEKVAGITEEYKPESMPMSEPLPGGRVAELVEKLFGKLSPELSSHFVDYRVKITVDNIYEEAIWAIFYDKFRLYFARIRGICEEQRSRRPLRRQSRFNKMGS